MSLTGGQLAEHCAGIQSLGVVQGNRMQSMQSVPEPWSQRRCICVYTVSWRIGLLVLPPCAVEFLLVTLMSCAV